MEEFTRIATAVFSIEDQPSEEKYQADVIFWRGTTWFVASEFRQLATGTRTPAELIPLQLLAPLTNDLGAVQLGRKLPKAFGLYPAPEAMRIEFQVEDVAVLFQSPQSSSIQ